MSRRSNVPSDGFYVPAANGGSQLTIVEDTFPAGLGEPINVIISAKSDSAVLKDQPNDGGLRNYFQSIGFSGECLGQHEGDDQQADLGDGHGALNETAVIRWDYGDPSLGTCKETINGGNHFRYWIQNGPKANSGAIFLAVSYELPVAQNHDIIFNGYNLARDQLVGNATNQTTSPPTLSFASPLPPPPPSSTTSSSTSSTNSSASSATLSSNSTLSATSTITTSSLTSTTTTSSSTVTSPLTSPTVATYLPTFTGRSNATGYIYETTATYLTGLLPNTSDGINHFQSVANSSGGINAVDGLVALLEVHILSAPAGANLKSAAAALRAPIQLLQLLLRSNLILSILIYTTNGLGLI
ncbi:hypothetical protein SISSUDRAFT_1061080 [Sistotremastrum suecicum HHB10207 ss-3]|uniref:Uncharacterized protein n=1 Tax=Sistotremastrum suecicum HHB10207 ss-3 TaxID=1314776 RepID=A0A166EDS0_9AGAM|nr:hypothetical protein SISSUDRAFT_1061080 [Sistotremastrum suecicum HHB10207 ss-3]